MIEAAVQKRFGEFSLDAAMSEDGFVCLAGRNGSGKTTLLRIVAGLTKPDGGHVKINGRDVTGAPLERRGVVMVTPESSIPSMREDEHLVWGAKLKGVEIGRERLQTVKEALGIDFRGKVGKLSLGMRERVSLATALLSAPAAILVDEAFSNLHEREGFISSYRKLSTDAGIDVVFSTQDDSDGRLAEHLYIMEEGRATKRF
ncbi:MAG TPA: ATP-binding cassette domain-containing protein [Nitrososphaerales archaeon]|nr:ATP-binding cassette domain-containing protein [Nitrososphaerales archaeon]